MNRSAVVFVTVLLLLGISVAVWRMTLPARPERAAESNAPLPPEEVKDAILAIPVARDDRFVPTDEKDTSAAPPVAEAVPAVAKVEGGEVSGRVRADGGPVAGATVSASCVETCASATAETDTQGRYTLSGLTQPKDYSITVVAEGFAEMTRLVETREKNIRGIDFDLEKGAALSGQVVNKDAVPLGLCTVYLVFRADESPEWPPDGYDVVGIYRTVPTDAGGRFAMENLPPGTYTFYVSRSSSEYTARLPTLTPPITLALGETLNNVQVMIANLEEQFIEGYVRDADGTPLEGVKVAASPDIYNAPNDRAETDVHGFYRMDGLGDQPLDVWFECPDGESLRLRDVPVGASDVNVTFADPGTIIGTVVEAATGELVADFTLSVRVQLSNGRDTTSPISSDEFRQVGEKDGPEFRLGPKAGQFTISEVYPGIATVRVTSRGYTTEDFGDIPVVTDQVTDVQLALSPASAFEGDILIPEGSKLTIRRMAMRPLDDLPAVETIPVDANAHFYIDDLDPNTYSVMIWLDSPDGATVKLERDIEIPKGTVVTENFEVTE